MKDIYVYIKLGKDERQAHLRLSESCTIRGGKGNTSYFKGLLAHMLDTTIPEGMSIHACHACHNAKCSNPYHLYWGTASENAMDRMSNGDLTVWEKSVKKNGLDEARRRQGSGRNQALGGRNNKGKPKSVEHRQKIADSMKRKYNAKVGER